jgi:hypothetical protein
VVHDLVLTSVAWKIAHAFRIKKGEVWQPGEKAIQVHYRNTVKPSLLHEIIRRNDFFGVGIVMVA